MPTSDEHVGASIRALRKAMGWSQALLADALGEAGIPGWYPQTVVRVEQGTRPLRLVEGEAVAAVLGIDLEQLLEKQIDAPDDRRARRAIANLRGASDAMLRHLRGLRVAEAELTYLRGADLSPALADQLTRTLDQHGADATLGRLAETAKHSPDLEHIAEHGPGPDDDVLAAQHAQQQHDAERMK